MKNGRSPLGRFLSGSPPGPGRPRKGRRAARSIVLFEVLRAAVNAHLEGDPQADLEDVVGAAELLLQRAREIRSRDLAGAFDSRPAGRPGGIREPGEPT